MVQWLNAGEKIVTIGPNQKDWTHIEDVSRHVLNAIITAEDARFYSHSGLDYTEIVNSLKKNISRGRYVRGASTITQQVVKLTFLSGEKSLFRKYREALGAILVEYLVSKDHILEWYINVVSFGDHVYGINGAAEHYFDTKAELLTIQQGANLALVIPGPNAWSIGLKQKRLTDFGHKRYAQIIERMWQGRMITHSLRLNALATGDFGRPVKGYHDIFLKTKAYENLHRFNRAPQYPETQSKEKKINE